MFLRLTTSTLLLTACLTAQGVTGELHTLSNVGVFAQQGNQTGFDSIPAGKRIAPGVGANASTHINNGNSHMATLIGFNNWASGVVTVDLSEQGGVTVGSGQRPATVGTTASSAGAFIVRPGPHSIILKLTGRPGSIGLVDTWATGGIGGGTSGVAGTYVLDVGNDGSPEFKAPAIGHESHSFVRKMPASGVLMVRLTAEVKAVQAVVGGFVFKSGMSFRWSPAPFCVMRPYGDGCGPSLEGKVARNLARYEVGLAYTKGTPGASAVLILGIHRTAIQIPGVRCSLLTRPLFTVPFRVGANGSATWNLRLPIVPYDLRLQAAELGALTLRFSNGLHFACYQ